MNGLTLRETFDATVAVLEEVRAEQHRLVDRENAGEDLPQELRACQIAWPAILAKWELLRYAQEHPDELTPAELGILLAWLHGNLVALREALAGRQPLIDPREN